MHPDFLEKVVGHFYVLREVEGEGEEGEAAGRKDGEAAGGDKSTSTGGKAGDDVEAGGGEEAAVGKAGRGKEADEEPERPSGVAPDFVVRPRAGWARWVPRCLLPRSYQHRPGKRAVWVPKDKAAFMQTPQVGARRRARAAHCARWRAVCAGHWRGLCVAGGGQGLS